MISFYSYTEYHMLSFIMALVLTSVFQSTNIASVYVMEFQPAAKRLRIMIEGVVLLQLFVEILMLTQIMYYIQNRQFGQDYQDIPMHDILRYITYALILGSQIFLFIRTKRWQVFLLLAASLVMLPVTDTLLGKAYPYIFLLSVIYLGVRAYSLTIFYNKKRQDHLPGVSIKQAMDLLPSGVLVVNSSGQIVFMNDKMHMLLFDIMGKLPNDFYKIYWHLLRKTVHSKEDKMMLDGKILYNEKNNTYWMFQRKDPQIKNETSAVFVASDITEEWNMMLNLKEQTKNLEKQSKELDIAMSDMEEECREQEIIALKGLFHDVLGQKIALLLRALREKKEPEEDLLNEFMDGIPEIELLARQKYDAGKRLDVLIKTFSGIGVTLDIEGSLPDHSEYAGAITEIIHEAATNAVRHGYARRIHIIFRENEREYSVRITNDGITPEHTMIEGNGIKGMRKKIMYVGGYLMIDRIPEFAIIAMIPKPVNCKENRCKKEPAK